MSGRRRPTPNTRPMLEAAEPRASDEARSGNGFGLIVEEPGRAVRLHLLQPSDTVIGTDDSCDLALRGRFLSRRHCVLRLRGGVLEIEDLGSRNGTEVDGRRAERQVLAADALVHLGDVSLTIVADRGTPGAEIDSAAPPACRFAGMVGADAESIARFHLLNKVAASRTSVLLEGPSGVGKELAALAVHQRSRRRTERPFVVVNCGALPETLAEAELFGCRRGAFTGATRDRRGAFVRADGGTLFLDEVGELPPETQPKLLRVLESGEVQALGASRARQTDVRVVAATNRTLRREALEGRFRTDLLFRLDGVTIRLSALEQRRDDILPIATAVLAALAGHGRALSPSACRWIAQQSWPGNVRQLKHHLQAALALTRRPVLRASDLAQVGRPGGGDSRPLAAVPETFMDRAIVTMLAHHHGSRAAAIRALGIPRSTFYARLRRLRSAGCSALQR